MLWERQGLQTAKFFCYFCITSSGSHTLLAFPLPSKSPDVAAAPLGWLCPLKLVFPGTAVLATGRQDRGSLPSCHPFVPASLCFQFKVAVEPFPCRSHSSSKQPSQLLSVDQLTVITGTELGDGWRETFREPIPSHE